MAKAVGAPTSKHTIELEEAMNDAQAKAVEVMKRLKYID